MIVWLRLFPVATVLCLASTVVEVVESGASQCSLQAPPRVAANTVLLQTQRRVGGSDRDTNSAAVTAGQRTGTDSKEAAVGETNKLWPFDYIFGTSAPTTTTRAPHYRHVSEDANSTSTNAGRNLTNNSSSNSSNSTHHTQSHHHSKRSPHHHSNRSAAGTNWSSGVSDAVNDSATAWANSSAGNSSYPNISFGDISNFAEYIRHAHKRRHQHRNWPPDPSWHGDDGSNRGHDKDSRNASSNASDTMFSKGEVPLDCHDPADDESCYQHVMWSKLVGVRSHPEWYPGLTHESRPEQFQAYLYQLGADCPPPCVPKKDFEGCLDAGRSVRARFEEVTGCVPETFAVLQCNEHQDGNDTVYIMKMDAKPCGTRGFAHAWVSRQRGEADNSAELRALDLHVDQGTQLPST